MWLLISIYGISQGLGETYMSMSTDYYLKEDLKMEPANAQAIKTLIHLPWNIKPVRCHRRRRCRCLDHGRRLALRHDHISHSPFRHSPTAAPQLYGLISDTLPILGYHRGPYIFLAGALGTMSWVILSINSKPSVGLSAFLFLLANYSIASPDVIIDAAVTGACLAAGSVSCCAGERNVPSSAITT